MTSLSVNLEDTVKIAADDLFGSYGLNTVEAIKMFVYTAVKTNHFPITFDVELEEPRQSMAEAISDTLNDANLYGPYKTAREAINEALKD